MKEQFALFLGETLVNFCLGILNTLPSLCFNETVPTFPHLQPNG